MQREGGKVIIVENGEPIFVLLSYKEYRDRQRRAEPEEVVPDRRDSDDELTIDDLPI